MAPDLTHPCGPSVRAGLGASGESRPAGSAVALSVGPSRAHSLRSACAVAWRTLGFSPAGPRGGRADPRALRCTTTSEAGLPTSHLVAGDATGARLLLVHGTPGSAQGWAEYLLEPPAGFEVLALDRPGFGESAPEAAVTSLDAQAAAVAALLPRDGRPAVVLGHSLGGAVAARVAAEHPGRVDALVLLAAALDPALERTHALQRLGRWPPVHALLPRALRNANAELLALQAELATMAALLGRIRCPVFIVHGTDDDLVPVANAAFAQRHLRGAAQVTTRLLPGHDHFLPWNAALEVRRVVAAAGSAAC